MSSFPSLQELMVIGPLEVDDLSVGWRLDKFLQYKLPEFSRTRLQDLLKQGHISLLGGDSGTAIPGLTASYKVRHGERYEIRVPQPTEAIPQPQDLPLTILFEDEDLLVIDKPPGLVVHPAVGHASDTLVNGLLAHCGDSLSGIGGVKRPGIVHRLDKETSGLLVVAKNDRAHHGLSKQFAAEDSKGPTGRQLKREYWAAVWGSIDSAGTITGAIGRSPTNRQKMAVVTTGGKPSITHYKRMTLLGSAPVSTSAKKTVQRQPISIVLCQLETGRTHQIRVHLKHRGFPLVGDPLYGGTLKAGHRLWPSFVYEFPRQALHAQKLEFIHPTHGQLMQFESPLPEDLAQLLNWIEG